MRISIDNKNIVVINIEDTVILFNYEDRSSAVYTRRTLGDAWWRLYGSCKPISGMKNNYFAKLLHSLASDIITESYTVQHYNTIMKYIPIMFGLNTGQSATQFFAGTLAHNVNFIEEVKCSCGCDDEPVLQNIYPTMEMGVSQHACPACNRATAAFDEDITAYELIMHWNLSVLYPVFMEEYNA